MTDEQAVALLQILADQSEGDRRETFKEAADCIAMDDIHECLRQTLNNLVSYGDRDKCEIFADIIAALTLPVGFRR